MKFRERLEKFLQDQTKTSIDLANVAYQISFIDRDGLVIINSVDEKVERPSKGYTMELEEYLIVYGDDQIRDIEINNMSIAEFIAANKKKPARIYFPYIPGVRPNQKQDRTDDKSDSEPPTPNEEQHPVFKEISDILQSDAWKQFFSLKLFDQGIGVDLVPTTRFNGDKEISIFKLYNEFFDVAFALEIELEAHNAASIRYIYEGDNKKQISLFDSDALQKCLNLLQEKIALHVTKTKIIDVQNSVVEMSSTTVHNSKKGLRNQDSIGVFLIKPDENQQGFFKESRELITEILEDAKKNIDPDHLEENGSTFCGAAIWAGETPRDAIISIGNLGDSRAFLVVRNAQGQEVLISLTQDADPRVTRFKNKVVSDGGRVEGAYVVKRFGGGLGMTASFGDKNVLGISHEPEFYEYHLGDLLDSIPKLEGYEPVKIITVSDGITALESPDPNIQAYPTPHYTVECAEPYGETADKKFTRHGLKTDPHFSYSAQSLVAHTVNEIKHLDDNSGVEVNLEKLVKGQKLFALIGDGHGKEAGELVSQALKKSAVENKKLIQLPNHATQVDLQRLNVVQAEEHQLYTQQSTDSEGFNELMRRCDEVLTKSPSGHTADRLKERNLEKEKDD